jgi:HPt (histidine-containing phosphotransfer) domain-containing protein
MDQSDWVKSAKLIHQIKPSLTLMGIHALKEPVQEIEDALKQVTKSGKGKALAKQDKAKLNTFLADLEKTIAELTRVMNAL